MKQSLVLLLAFLGSWSDCIEVLPGKGQDATELKEFSNYYTAPDSSSIILEFVMHEMISLTRGLNLSDLEFTKEVKWGFKRIHEDSWSFDDNELYVEPTRCKTAPTFQKSQLSKRTKVEITCRSRLRLPKMNERHEGVYGCFAHIAIYRPDALIRAFDDEESVMLFVVEPSLTSMVVTSLVIIVVVIILVSTALCRLSGRKPVVEYIGLGQDPVSEVVKVEPGPQTQSQPQLEVVRTSFIDSRQVVIPYTPPRYILESPIGIETKYHHNPSLAELLQRLSSLEESDQDIPKKVSLEEGQSERIQGEKPELSGSTRIYSNHSLENPLGIRAGPRVGRGCNVAEPRQGGTETSGQLMPLHLTITEGDENMDS